MFAISLSVKDAGHLNRQPGVLVPPFELRPLHAMQRAYAHGSAKTNAAWIGCAVVLVAVALGCQPAHAAPGSGGLGVGHGLAGGAGGGYSGVYHTSAAPSGGNGGAGQSTNGYNHGGAGGVVGATVSSPTDVTTTITGGNGGDAIPGDPLVFHGASGGGGGAGIYAAGYAPITLDAGAQVLGGDGGAGAGGRPGSNTSEAGGGGGGGSGIVFTNGGTLVNNGGLVQGGNGGGGADRWGTSTSASGAGGGGAAVQGSSVYIINSGTLAGGTGGLGGESGSGPAGDGQQGAAIKWTGGSQNRLQMDAGSVINGAIWVQSGATAEVVANTQGLVMDNSFVFDGEGILDTQANTLTVQGVISGSGSLEKTGNGLLVLSGNNTYQGGATASAGTIITSVDSNLGATGAALTLNGGTVQASASYAMTRDITLGSAGGALLADDGVVLTVDGLIKDAATGSVGTLNKTGRGTLILNGANSYTGSTNVAAGTLQAGAVNTLSANSAFIVASSGTLDLDGNDQRISAMSNSGVVSLLGAAPGTTLTVTDHWQGKGGILRLGTTLDDDASISDRLVLDGASARATGVTNLQIVNLNGLGALTAGDGIEVVSALNGATTTAQTSKSAFQLLGGRVDAGAFEYRLYAADADGNGENWYLRSNLPISGAAGAAGTASTAAKPSYREEVLLYSALPEQLRQADQAMLGTLYQRMGDGGVSGEAQRHSWGRAINTDRTINQSGPVSPTSEGRLNGFQVGSDLWGNSSWRVGAYLGQLEGDMSVSGVYGGSANSAVGGNDLRGQYLGTYATWRDGSGGYVDTVLQAGRYRYTTHPDRNTSSNGQGQSVSVSLEVGRLFALSPHWAIEPQLQLVHQAMDLNDVGIDAANISQHNPASWLGRAGARLKGTFASSAGLIRPYAQVNVYKSSTSADVTRFAGPAGSADVRTPGGSSSSDVTIGTSWQLSPRYTVYGELGKRWSLGDQTQVSSGVDATVGVSMSW